MTDEPLRHLAQLAGISPKWVDAQGQPHQIAPDTLHFVLRELGVASATSGQIQESINTIGMIASSPTFSSLLIADVGKPIRLPALPGLEVGVKYRIELEDGPSVEGQLAADSEGLALPAIDNFGYHRLLILEHETTIAVAPPRCFTINDLALQVPNGLWGFAAPIYGLRRKSDGGIGDFTALAEYGRAAASLGAAAFVINPVHALFSAAPDRFSPYSPSSRAFYNPLYTDACDVFGEQTVRAALSELAPENELAELEALPLIDWPRAARFRMRLFRNLFDRLAPENPARKEFLSFRQQGQELLEDHARFETLHAYLTAQSSVFNDWRNWPTEYRDPRHEAVGEFSRAHEDDVAFHAFLQWLAARGLAGAQKACRDAGMPIGLITDLAIGAEAKGSHSWSRQGETLERLSIGAPADAFNTRGQSWGIVPLNPHTMQRYGFCAFREALRATMIHAGGIRIDHAMGLARLWVVPHGATPADGAYINYPLSDLMRIIALESWKNRTIVMGEDLGTVPGGFRAMLHEAGILGTQVMWFERDLGGYFAPDHYSRDAMATTSTHDLPTVAGWWSGHDIEDRLRVGVSDTEEAGREREWRNSEREALWRSFKANGATDCEQPSPSQSDAAVDAAVTYMAKAASPLVILPLFDAYALDEQENMPGTFDEFPNWRRRLPGDSTALTQPGRINARIAMFARNRSGAKQ